MIIHLNSKENGKLSRDYKLLNTAAYCNRLFIVLMQVIMPISTHLFDEYYKTKYKERVEIECDNIIDSMLSLEIIVHSSGIIPTVEYLPQSKMRNLLFYCTLDKDDDYTYTLFVSTIKCAASKTTGIVISINTERIHLLYELIPYELSK